MIFLLFQVFLLQLYPSIQYSPHSTETGSTLQNLQDDDVQGAGIRVLMGNQEKVSMRLIFVEMYSVDALIITKDKAFLTNWCKRTRINSILMRFFNT
jgi:hypothetical protein